MDESSAREVLLLQAFESVVPPSPNWSDADSAWATRLALGDTLAPSAASAGPDSDANRFVAARARHAMQRLLPREPVASKWLARRLWRAQWIVWAALGGFIAGLVADSIGSDQRINLLAPPVWTVVVWNLVVYLLLAGGALRRLAGRPARRPGFGGRLVGRLLRVGRRLPGPVLDGDPPAGGSSAAMQAFAGRWARLVAPLSTARAATLLHAAAAALGVGLASGLYARGLVLDYRAAWESTFLSPASVHAVLATLLWPAARLSGIALPDVGGFAALQVAHASGAAGVSAAPWIHLYAWTLALAVVLPRTALALASGLRARWLGAHLTLPIDDAYFQRLLLQRRGDAARVEVFPYAQAPGPQAAPALRALLAGVLGEALQLQVAATTAFGAEDDAAGLPSPASATTLQIALFDLGATPEAESHGRFVRALASTAPPGAATILLVDEAGFKRRFGADSVRLAQRRDAWSRLAESIGSVAVCVDLDSPAVVQMQRRLHAAIAAPVRAHA